MKFFENECVLVYLKVRQLLIFLLAQVTNTWLCRSGPRQLFFPCLLLGQVQVGLTLFIHVSLQWISKTLFFLLRHFLRKLRLSVVFGT